MRKKTHYEITEPELCSILSEHLRKTHHINPGTSLRIEWVKGVFFFTPSYLDVTIIEPTERMQYREHTLTVTENKKKVKP